VSTENTQTVIKPGKINNRALRRLAAKNDCPVYVLWLMKQAGVVKPSQKRVPKATVEAALRSRTVTGAV